MGEMNYFIAGPPDPTGEIIFNGQRSCTFMIANSKEGWIETFIPITNKSDKFPHFLKDENGKEIIIRLKGKVEIFELDKRGNRIKVK
jgi:hypothetical protein